MGAEPRGILHLQSFFGSTLNVKLASEKSRDFSEAFSLSIAQQNLTPDILAQISSTIAPNYTLVSESINHLSIS